jgi:hypothetical protein
VQHAAADHRHAARGRPSAQRAEEIEHARVVEAHVADDENDAAVDLLEGLGYRLGADQLGLLAEHLAHRSDALAGAGHQDARPRVHA